MNRALKFGLPMVFIFTWLVAMLPCAFAKDRIFHGKVIDYETREPIEGAVVVAYWDEGRATLAGQSTRLKEVKETLTDKNGEWSIIGPKGRPHDPNPIFSLITGIHYTQQPLFVVFKPGYEPFKTGSFVCTFLAYAYVNKKRGLEGIILEIREKEKDYEKKYFAKHPDAVFINGLPFISVKNPESKLRSLDIPFDYGEDIGREDIKGNDFFYFKNYTLAGLKQLTSKKERLKASLSPEYSYSDDPRKEREFLKKQKEFLRLLNEEDRDHGLSENKMYKEIINEK
jgi:hypothetical protein